MLPQKKRFIDIVDLIYLEKSAKFLGVKEETIDMHSLLIYPNISSKYIQSLDMKASILWMSSFEDQSLRPVERPRQ
jgi:hypothetical protein